MDSGKSDSGGVGGWGGGVSGVVGDGGTVVEKEVAYKC